MPFELTPLGPERPEETYIIIGSTLYRAERVDEWLYIPRYAVTRRVVDERGGDEDVKYRKEVVSK